jgi:hypothetical protein
VVVAVALLYASTCALVLRYDDSLLAPHAAASAPAAPTPQQGAGHGKAAGANSESCVNCHQGIEPMHGLWRAPDEALPADAAQRGMDRQGLTCVDCHGGNGAAATREAAHVQPRNKKIFSSSANPKDSYAALNEESPEFVRFMNPSDYRVADATCGQCHADVLSRARKSIMAHNAMVHNAVFYNNGAIETKIARYGEAFDSQGRPAELIDSTPPSPEARAHGALDKVTPHAEFQISKIKDSLRIAEVNNPALGTRGPGTKGRIAATFLNVMKTRLNDPTTWFLGPNKIAGDYRNSGCASCHVIYANDRSYLASGEYAKYGNSGQTFTNDKAMTEVKARREPGHPIKHQFSLTIPVAQCMTCHYHQGDGAIGTFLGRIWWDRETDADAVKAAGAEPEYGKAMEAMAEYNSELVNVMSADVSGGKPAKFSQTQFSDFHAHGWNFVNVYKRDLKGRLLDDSGNVIPDHDPDKFKKAVHLRDIHLEKGMQCIDCHTLQDSHGDGNIYSQMTDYIEIRCVDCHGTVNGPTDLKTSGHSWARNDLSKAKTPFVDPTDPERRRRLLQFYVRESDGKIIQRSMTLPGVEWQVTQVADVVNPDKPEYSPRAAYAKLMRRDGTVAPNGDRQNLSHTYEKIECQTCHSSWQTTCSGCHLPLDLNVKSKDKHYDDRYSRGYAGYFSQAIRTDTFFVGIGTKNHGSKLTPFRPASAVVVSAWDRNRNNVVHQQALVSAAGFSNEAMTPHPPHTVRVKETRTCSDCHLSERGDNNARISLLLGFGANGLNFMGTYAYLAEQGKGVTAIKVTDGFEPQPVIGSNFQRVLDPAGYDKFVARGRKLDTAYRHRATGIQAVAARGEYLLAAEGTHGVRVYDIANINNKSVAQRIVRAVNSPLGEKLGVSTRHATFVHLPSSLPVHVGSNRRVLNRTKTLPQIRAENEEPGFHDLYRYALITDADEGLILADVDTLTDADPENNRIKRVSTFNPDGKLSGARMVKNLGTYAFVVSEKTGLTVVDLADPDTPRLAYHNPPGALNGARAIELQLRYAFILDRDGLKVWDLTDRENPRPVPGAMVALADARGLTVSRTFAYIAAGRQGLVIVDVEAPEKPRVFEYDRSQAPLDDAYDVTVATTNVSFFAYVADGRNGLKVVRLVEPPDTPGHLGFNPNPTPKLIATYPTGGIAVAVNRGQVRDRFVDEAGNQMVISNRYGARTLNYDEIRRFLYYPDGKLLTVSDDVPKFLYDTRTTEWQTTKAAEK